MDLPRHTRLVLAGGNALGAYQGGAYQALHESGRLPEWVAGTSVGALNGAVIAGNAPDVRVERLREVWRLAEQWPKDDPAAGGGSWDWRWARTLSALGTMVTGRPGLFHPKLPMPWPALGLTATSGGLFDTRPMLRTLESFVDFDRLNDGESRFIAAAVDAETGEDVVLDTARERIGPEHLRASAAFPGLYPPVELNGRVLVDGGLSMNLPLAPVLLPVPGEDTLCIAVDLVSPSGPRPASLADSTKRVLDLLLASQSRRAFEQIRLEYRLADHAGSNGRVGPRAAVTVVHLIYSEDGTESAAKVLDFSSGSIRKRWQTGYRDMAAALDALSSANVRPAQGPFQAYRFNAGTLTPYPA